MLLLRPNASAIAGMVSAGNKAWTLVTIARLAHSPANAIKKCRRTLPSASNRLDYELELGCVIGLEPGDLVEMEVEHIGILRNRLGDKVDADPAYRFSAPDQGPVE